MSKKENPRLDSLANHLNNLAGRKRFDAMFIGEVLEALEPKVYETQYSMLKAAEIFNVNTSLPAGASHYKYHALDSTGEAALYSNGATDVPMLDVSKAESIVPVQSYALGFSYTLEDFEAAAMAGAEALDATRGRMTLQALERKLDTVAANGDQGIGAGISPTGKTSATLTTVNYTGATSAQIIQNVADILTKYQETANDSMWADTPVDLVFPSTARGIHAQPFADTNPQPIEAVLRQTYGGMIGKIHYWSKLNDKGANSEGAIMAFPNVPDVVEYILPQAPIMTAPEAHVLGFRVYMKARTAGIVWKQPFLCVQADWNTP